MSIKATIYPLSLYMMFFFANGRHVMATGSSLSSSLSYRPRAPVHPELLLTEEEEEVGEGKGGGALRGPDESIDLTSQKMENR